VAKTLKSSGRVSVAVATSRVLGLVREQVFAALFGASAVADAFQVAFRIPNLLRDLFAEGALSSAFVPTFTSSLVDEDRERAYHLGNLIFTGLLLVTGTIVGLGMIFAEPIVVLIANGFDGDTAKVQLATELTRVMLPLLSVIALSAVWMGMLNAQRKFMAPAWAPAMFNVSSIAVGAVLLGMGLPVRDAVFAWSLGTMAAGVVQLMVQLPALWKAGYRPRLAIAGLRTDPRVRRIVRLMTPALVGLAAVQINIVINTRFAASLAMDGPIAQLAYAFRIFYLPIGVFSVAIAVVTTTRVSEDAARRDMDALRASTKEGMSAVWMLMSASAVGLWLLAEPVVRVLLERGAFSRADTIATAAVLQSYVIGLLPYGLVKILAPVFYGVDRPRLPLLASVCAVIVNVTFNALTYERLGAPGIALGTTLGACVNFLVLRASLSKVAGRLKPARRDAFALVFANAVLAGVVFAAWMGVEWLLGQAPIGQLAILVAGLAAVVALGFLVYVRTLAALGYPAADLLWSLPGRIFARLRPKRGRRADPAGSSDPGDPES
jgi:putative peptidoglycan lipid II flippase